jgi:hypothetical protein
VGTPVPSRRVAAENAAGESRRAGSTRKRASVGLLKCHETAICVRGRGHCELPDDTQRSNSVPGCGSRSGAVHSTPAGCTKNSKKNFCCVTTRRCNLWTVHRLRRGLGSFAAHALSLGVPRFDRCGLATLGLPSRGLPTADLAQAFRVLAIALVPLPRVIPSPATFAQTDPRARSSLSGTAAGLWLIVEGAHGSGFSQGSAR